MKGILLSFLILTTSACLVTGSDESAQFQVISRDIPLGAGEPISFDVLRSAIFEPLCLRCHSWAIHEAEVRRRMVPGHPERSRVYTMVEQGVMPPRGPDLSLEQLDLLRRYILELE